MRDASGKKHKITRRYGHSRKERETIGWIDVSKDEGSSARRRFSFVNRDAAGATSASSRLSRAETKQRGKKLYSLRISNFQFWPEIISTRIDFYIYIYIYLYRGSSRFTGQISCVSEAAPDHRSTISSTEPPHNITPRKKKQKNKKKL